MAAPDDYDLLVIGGGLTGLVAGWRAAAAGLRTAVIAATPGSLPFTSGALDLLAVFPTETKRFRSSPWEALSELAEQCPEHPYAKVGLSAVREAWQGLATFLQASSLRYYSQPEENLLLITAAGTLKPTQLVPGSMRANVEAWARREPTLIAGFHELSELAPEHVVAGLVDRWPGLRAVRLEPQPLLAAPLPQRVTPRVLAAAFETAAFRERFAAAIRPLLGEARYLGLPAVLGEAAVSAVCADLEARLGVAVFEIPLLSPSLPGLRLASLLQAQLRAAGAHYFQGRPCTKVRWSDQRVQVVRQGSSAEQRFTAAALLLCSGRFFGGGLTAHPGGIRECLLDLPLTTLGARDSWHMQTFLGAPGHPINRVGLEVDATLRVLDRQGQRVDDRLRAAGAILAHHDWVREKSGAGISVVTGWAAAKQLAQTLLPSQPSADLAAVAGKRSNA